MNQQIIDYLQTNKNNYTKESLIEQLHTAGHDGAEITEAVRDVYGDSEVAIKLSNDDAQANVKYAGFWIRFVAMFIDGIIIAVVSMIFVVPITFAIGENNMNQIWIQLFMFVVGLTYFIFMTNKYQATLGKKVVGVKVCDANTLGKASSGHIMTRELINRLFITIPFMALLDVIVAFTERKQGLHDMAAKTVVVYKNPNKKTNGAIIAVIVIICVLALVTIIGIFSSIVLVSLNSARDKAQEASVKSSISSTVPAAILCMDDGNNLTQIVPGTPICLGAMGNWPELDEFGQWGMMVDGDVSDGSFEYTAEYGDGEIAVCTEYGCKFDK